jgi:hypothetical protein
VAGELAGWVRVCVGIWGGLVWSGGGGGGGDGDGDGNGDGVGGNYGRSK